MGKISFSSRITRPKDRNSQSRLEAWNWKEEVSISSQSMWLKGRNSRSRLESWKRPLAMPWSKSYLWIGCIYINISQTLWVLLERMVPGLLNHIPVDQLDRDSPVRISILKRKNTGNANQYWKATSNHLALGLWKTVYGNSETKQGLTHLCPSLNIITNSASDEGYIWG